MTRFLLGAVLGTLLLVGCDQSAPAKPPATSQPVVPTVNRKCPIMPEHDVGADARVEFEGKMVGFCCAECIPPWNALSDEEKRAKLAQ